MKKAILLILAVCLVFSSCHKNSESGAVRFDAQHLPYSIDPQTAKDNSAALVIKNIFNGLTTIDRQGTTQPNCAQRWECSPDGLTYTFYLKDGLMWEDKTKLTAFDFEYALKRVVDPAIGSPWAFQYLSLENAQKILAGEMPTDMLGVDATDDCTLEIKLEYTDTNVPTLMAQQSSMPCNEKFFKAQKGRYGLSAAEILSNGAYSVWSWESDMLTFYPNINSSGAGKINRVYMCVGRGDATENFLNGRSEFCIATYKEHEELLAYESVMAEDENWAVIINNQSHVSGSPDLRRTIMGVLKRDELIAKLPEGTYESKNIISKTAMLSNSNFRDVAGDAVVKKATGNLRNDFFEQLADMGVEKFPKTTLLVSTDEPCPTMGGLSQSFWSSELSLHVNMEQVSTSALSARVESKDFDIAIAPIKAVGNHPEEYLRLFSGYEIEFENQTVTVQQALESLEGKSEEQAVKGYKAIEQNLIDLWYILPLYDAPSLFVSASNLEGVIYSIPYRTIDFTQGQILS